MIYWALAHNLNHNLVKLLPLPCIIRKVKVQSRRGSIRRDSLSGSHAIVTSEKDDFPRLEAPADVIISPTYQGDWQSGEGWPPVKHDTGLIWFWLSISATDDIVTNGRILTDPWKVSNWTGVARDWVENLGWSEVRSPVATGNYKS